MKYTIENTTRRPVSFLCNSGKACHLPPKLRVEIPANEIDGNAFIEKLNARRLLKIARPAQQTKKAPATTDKSRPSKSEAGKENKDKREK